MKGKKALDELLGNPVFLARSGGKTHFKECVKTILEELELLEEIVIIIKKKKGFNCQPVYHREEEQFTFYCKGLLSKNDKKLLERVINNDNTKIND
jgi:hypothetical protein